MDITYAGLAVGLLLLLIPIAVFWRFGAHLIRSTIVGAVRMVVQLALIGLYLKWLFVYNSVWVNLLWVIVMALVAAYTACRRVRLRLRAMLLPVAGSMILTSLIMGLWFLIAVVRLGSPFDARYFIPIIGILMGNMLTASVIGLNTYYDSLQRETTLYYYLLGCGATHLEAITPFIRRALEKAFAPTVANMAVMGLVSLPGTMIGQILGGAEPDVAIKYQMMIIVITIAAAAISLMATVYLADRHTFDAYGRMKKIRN